MPNTRISSLTPSTADLAAADVLPVVQTTGVGPVKMTGTQIKTGIIGAGSVSIASGKTFTSSNTLTLAGTDSTTMTFPSTSATIARTDAGNTFTGNQVVSSGSFGLSGNISRTAWTTSGVRYANVAATLTDTSSAGTVATAYTDLFGGNTIAASSATTFTNYYTSWFNSPITGTNVSFSNRWAMGLGGSLDVQAGNTLTSALNISQTWNNSAVNVTGASGNGTTATITFSTQSYLFPIGSTIVVSSVNPTAYNGTFVVTASSPTSVSYSSSASAAYVSGGTVQAQFTGLKFNVPTSVSAALSKYIDVQLGGVTQFAVGASAANGSTPTLWLGNATPTTGNHVLQFDGTNLFVQNAAASGGSIHFASNGSWGILAVGTGSLNNVRMGSTIPFGWTSSNAGLTTLDTILTRAAAATLQLGAASAAAPVAQTLQVQSVATGNSNVVGSNFTIKGSAGTGLGAGGSLLFQVAPAGPGGTFTVGFTNGSANITGTGLPTTAGTAVTFTTTDTLPTNFALATVYYVLSGSTSTTITVSTSVGGSAVTAGSAGLGTHTMRQDTAQNAYSTALTIAATKVITVADTYDIAVGTTTGTKIGTATSQKIGFWNATPIVQPATGGAAATVAATGTGDVVAASTTFDGYTIPQIVKAMRNAGLLA